MLIMNKPDKKSMDEKIKEIIWEEENHHMDYDTAKSHVEDRTKRILNFFTESLKGIPCCGHSCCCNLERNTNGK